MRIGLQARACLFAAGVSAALTLAVLLFIRSILPEALEDIQSRGLQRTAAMAGSMLEPTSASREEIQSALIQLAAEQQMRLSLIRPDGRVWADSAVPYADLDQLENHGSREEMTGAYRSGEGISIRWSETTRTRLMYAATRIADGWILRAALPMDPLDQIVQGALQGVLGIGLTCMIAAIGLAYRIAGQVAEPIAALKQVINQGADGDLRSPAPESGTGELAALGHSLNRMRTRLIRQLSELQDEKAELQATLATMVEGVLVVDASSRISLTNAALRATFALPDATHGRTLLEVFRHHDLQRLVEQVLTTDDTAADELVFAPEDERYFNVSAARLRNGSPEARGAVVVFHDITRIRRLEKVRRDFVANASHELRTPLSVIRGYVETLLDTPAPDPESTRTFLETIDRNARRLESLLKDLLSISELESNQTRLELETIELRPFSAGVLEELGRHASARSITLCNEVEASFPPVRADTRLVHQVLTNLIENAIKYSPEGSTVRVTASEKHRIAEICISDTGSGIAEEHLTRIFERFYRVDRARSRELGGTGLGLSIVKHIVQAHGGRVWAESTVGKGSRFYFTLNLASS